MGSMSAESKPFSAQITYNELVENDTQVRLGYGSNGLTDIEIIFGKENFKISELSVKPEERSSLQEVKTIFIHQGTEIQHHSVPDIDTAINMTNYYLSKQQKQTDTNSFNLLLSEEDLTHINLLTVEYSGLLYRVINEILKDRDESFDILQKVLIQLYLSYNTLRKGVELKGWLLTVARNKSIDELRRRKRIPLSFIEAEPENDEENNSNILDTFEATDFLPETAALQGELQETLVRAINNLPLKYRSVVGLRYYGQFSFAEIGRELNIPQETAKTYFHRAKKMLRNALSVDEL